MCWMGNGREVAAASGCSSGTATTSSFCAERDNKPSRPAGWWPRSWPRWGCTCTPTRPVSWGSQGPAGFDFLGFHHHKVESWRWRGRYYLQPWPATRAMNAIRAKIWEATDRRSVGHGLGWIVATLNRVLRGWAPTAVTALRAEVRRHRQLCPPAPGQLRQHQARPLLPPQLDPPVHLRGCGVGVYRLSGRVRSGAAHALRCTMSQSRVRKNCMHALTGGRWPTRPW